MYRIALDAGHSLNTNGKRCLVSLDPNETMEWVLNARIADKVEILLQGYTGYKLLRVDDPLGKKNISTANRAKAANNFDADDYLSLHHNAGVEGGAGGGIVVYIAKTASKESAEFQAELYNELIAATGLKGNRSNPTPKNNYTVLTKTKMSAALCELGFMDSKTDVPKILSEEYADQCAEAIVKVLVRRGNLVKKQVEPTTADFAVPVKALSRGDKGDHVKAMQILLIGRGVSCGGKGADGDFGSATEKAVVAFKKAAELVENGVCDAAAWMKLLGIT